MLFLKCWQLLLLKFCFASRCSALKTWLSRIARSLSIISIPAHRLLESLISSCLRAAKAVQRKNLNENRIRYRLRWCRANRVCMLIVDFFPFKYFISEFTAESSRKFEAYFSFTLMLNVQFLLCWKCLSDVLLFHIAFAIVEHKI